MISGDFRVWALGPVCLLIIDIHIDYLYLCALAAQNNNTYREAIKRIEDIPAGLVRGGSPVGRVRGGAPVGLPRGGIRAGPARGGIRAIGGASVHRRDKCPSAG